jgi:hypothetical protein
MTTVEFFRDHALRYATGTTPLAKVLADLKVAFLKEK